MTGLMIFTVQAPVICGLARVSVDAQVNDAMAVVQVPSLYAVTVDLSEVPTRETPFIVIRTVFDVASAPAGAAIVVQVVLIALAVKAAVRRQKFGPFRA